MSIAKNASKYFLLESKRKLLAKTGELSQLKKTYLSKLVLPNKNTGNFWDAKFSELESDNWMELDRNKTAATWFTGILQPGMETLNIGCGDGNFEKLISKIRRTIFRHTAVDIALTSLKRLRKNIPNFTFKKLDIVNDSVEKNAYSVVCMFEVLEHIPPQKTFSVLKKIHSLLKKGGMILISVPMNEGLEKMYPLNPNEHLRCYSTELILAELKISGFHILKHKHFYAFSRNYWAKDFIARTILRNKWQPNNILILAQKK